MKLRNLLGISIYDIKMADIVKYLDNVIKLNQKKSIFGISAAAFARLKFRPDLYGIYKKFDVLIAEGAGIPLLAKLFGIKISEKIGLVNLTYSLLELANKNSYRILLFGATQEVNELTAQKINSRYPNIKLCKGINGYFEEEELDTIVEKINTCQPQILLVGISYPIKERFTIKYKQKLNANLIVPCGGAFEVIAGKVKVPKIKFKRIPVAWIYRLIQEPRRMFKDVLVTVLYSVFWVIPILYFKHLFRIERNPDIGKFFKLSGEEWDSTNGSIKA